MSRREYFGNWRIKRLRVRSFVEVVNKKEEDVLKYIFETEGAGGIENYSEKYGHQVVE